MLCPIISHWQYGRRKHLVASRTSRSLELCITNPSASPWTSCALLRVFCRSLAWAALAQANLTGHAQDSPLSADSVQRRKRLPRRQRRQSVYQTPSRILEANGRTQVPPRQAWDYQSSRLHEGLHGHPSQGHRLETACLLPAQSHVPTNGWRTFSPSHRACTCQAVPGTTHCRIPGAIYSQ